jgi:hypothetical protein
MGESRDKEHLDDLLDKALAGTFPASDPVSSLGSTRRRPAGNESEKQADEKDVGQQAVDEPGRDERR